MRWKYFSVFCALFLLLSPAFSESETEFTVPSLEPEAVYEMTGQDIMSLYQEINDLTNSKNNCVSIADEAIKLAKDLNTSVLEYEKENQKLVLSNNFLIGTTVCSVGIVVAGVITLVVMNIN